VNGFTSEAATAIRILLVANVTANLVLVESNGRDRVTSRPEVFSGEVPLFALHPGNGYRALALNESKGVSHPSNGILGAILNTDLQAVERIEATRSR
jgi:hypothetical protein